MKSDTHAHTHSERYTLCQAKIYADLHYAGIFYQFIQICLSSDESAQALKKRN